MVNAEYSSLGTDFLVVKNNATDMDRAMATVVEKPFFDPKKKLAAS